jgi:hypothetical protein
MHVFLEALIFVVVCGTTLYVMSLVNPAKKVEEYYRVESPACFFALQLCTVLIVMCFAINARFLVSEVSSILFVVPSK